MIKCYEIYLNQSAGYTKMSHVMFINLENVKHIIISEAKFNNEPIFNVFFIDNSRALILSDQLKNMLMGE